MTLDEIRAYFLAKGVSQQEVGRFIGVDSRTIRRWFSGKDKWPHLFELAVQADIFGVEHHPEERVKNKLVLKKSTEQERSGTMEGQQPSGETNGSAPNLPRDTP